MFQEPWCLACCRRQKAKGVSVIRLHSLPISSFARRDLKNEPCPQSCWMMKMRTRNPAASADIGSVIQSPTARHRYIAMQVAKNPPNDDASCPRLRANIGARKAIVLERIWSI